MAATCDASAVGCWGPRKSDRGILLQVFHCPRNPVALLEKAVMSSFIQKALVCSRRFGWGGWTGSPRGLLHLKYWVRKSSHSVNWLFCIFKPWIIFYWKYYENRRGNIRIPLIENRNIQTTDKWWYRERLDEEEFNEQYLTNPKSMIRSHLFDCQVHQVWFKS